MMKNTLSSTCFLLVWTLSQMAQASFAFTTTIETKNQRNAMTTRSVTTQQRPSSSCLKMAPGGWGIGTPLDFKEEEHSSSSQGRRRRKRRKDSSSSDSDEVAYNAETSEKIAEIFAMQNPTQFSQRVNSDRDNLQLQKKKDLMEIAKIAGLGDRMKSKVNRKINQSGGLTDKFDLDDNDDDLDVRVQWEE
jgi:hypothetical protein